MSVSGIPETDISGTIPEVRLKVDMIRNYCIATRPAKLGRVKTSRFTRTTKMRHPSTYDDAQCATRDAVTNIHVYQY